MVWIFYLWSHTVSSILLLIWMSRQRGFMPGYAHTNSRDLHFKLNGALFIRNGFQFKRNKVFLSIRLDLLLLLHFNQSNWIDKILNGKVSSKCCCIVFQMMAYKWLNEADTEVWLHSKQKRMYSLTSKHTHLDVRTQTQELLPICESKSNSPHVFHWKWEVSMLLIQTFSTNFLSH